MSTEFLKNNIFKKFLIILILVFVLSPISISQAAINKQINYQAKLTGNSGVAVTNGTYNMEFALYTALSGGTAIWTEARTGLNKVQVTSGLFSVLLGEITTLASVDFNQTLYLGVNIGGTGAPGWDGEMSPRKKLGAVPAAVVAENAINIIGGNAGAVPYQSATGITGFSDLFWDNINKRLGVGTPTPTSMVSLSSTAASPRVTLTYPADDSTYSPSILFRAGATPSDRLIMGYDTNAYAFKISQSGTFGISDRLIIDNGSTWFKGNPVGIGSLGANSDVALNVVQTWANSDRTGIYNEHSSSSGINKLTGIFTKVNSGSGTLVNSYPLYVANGSGTITNQYGLYLENMTAGANNWSIYSAGGQSYFAGNVGIGVTNPTAKLHLVAGSDVANGAPLKLTSGTLTTGANISAGAVEFITDVAYLTRTTATARVPFTMGSGTINEIPYWVDANTLGSLTVATYPSLTELSYVKGSTSAIQTQLNGKLGTALTSGNIFIGNVSNVATGVALSGDASLSNTGVLGVNKTRLNIRNETGTTIASTKAVYVSGYNSFPLITLANNTAETAHNVVGITIAPINDQTNGFIATSGQLDAETNSWTVGTELYLGAAGALTSTAPTSGAVRHVAIVTVQANYPVGKLLIYQFPEENYVAGGANVDTILRTGDDAGTNKFSLRNYSNTEKASINSNGVINSVALTASEILGTDASKNLVSLPLATYPSLTELSYVKGLSSAVQTQLGGKASLALDNLASVAMNASLQWNNTVAQTLDIAPTANTVVGRALTISAGSTVTGGTADMAGGDLTLNSGLGKGTGASSIIFKTGTTLTTGSTLQTLSTKMTILGSGNVGIGTTNPSYILDVGN
ncbi:MAG: hypothetical protein WCP17_03570, partial [bacterium]